jgi:hypothetical protein
MRRVRGLVIMGAIGFLWVLSILSGTASSAMIYSENFAGTDGVGITAYNPLYTLVSGTGTAEVDSPGLSLPGKGASGNSLKMNNSSLTPALKYKLDVPDQTLSSTNPLYVSAMFKATEIGWYGNLIVGIPLTTGTTTKDSYFGIGVPLQGVLRVVANNGVTQTTLASYSADSTVQVITKYQLNTNANKVNMKAAINPSSITAEPTWTDLGSFNITAGVPWYISDFSVSALAGTVTGGAKNISAGWIDEIRIATTYSEAVATPIPAAAWLLGSGLIGLVAIRRRNKK